EDERDLRTLPARPDELPAATPVWRTLTDLPRVHVAGRTYFALGVPLGTAEEPRGIVYIFYPESLWREAIWAAVRPSLYVRTVGGVGGGLWAGVVPKRLTRLVRGRERRPGLTAAGDFSPMPFPRRNDELRDLARSVNDMAQQLAQYQEAVKKTERLRLLGQVS